MDQDRRQFLKTSTGVLTGVVLAGSPLALIAGGKAWAVEMKTLTSAEATVLMSVVRTIAPHDKLDDAAYALVVHAVDACAAKDEDSRRLFKDGIARLGSSFAKNSESERVMALKNVESSEFFKTMRLKTMQVLYTSPIAYAYFGYEGEAFSKGGYVLRGFNDLHWLPEVPLEDSGPMPV